MYDIIGDIHGQSEKLVYLLKKLGYKKSDQGWQHSVNKAIFVGDFIDRGPYQLETLNFVYEMVKSNNAYAIMGNHEFNAIGWAIKKNGDTEEYLRPHTEKNRHQHNAFLNAVNEESMLHRTWIDWFKSLPLFLELPDINIIHACWDQSSINNIKPFLNNNNVLRSENIALAFNESSQLFELCEILLKGKEIALPDGFSYNDKDGNVRHRARVKWWETDATYLSDICVLNADQLSSLPKQHIDITEYLYRGKVPVFFGHYWFTGVPNILSPQIACLDYSAAIHDNKLVAYRWQGETELTNKNFIY